MSCSPPSPQTRLCVSAQSPSFPKPPLAPRCGWCPGKGSCREVTWCMRKPVPCPPPPSLPQVSHNHFTIKVLKGLPCGTCASWPSALANLAGACTSLRARRASSSRPRTLDGRAPGFLLRPLPSPPVPGCPLPSSSLAGDRCTLSPRRSPTRAPASSHHQTHKPPPLATVKDASLLLTGADPSDGPWIQIPHLLQASVLVTEPRSRTTTFSTGSVPLAHKMPWYRFS